MDLKGLIEKLKKTAKFKDSLTSWNGSPEDND